MNNDWDGSGTIIKDINEKTSDSELVKWYNNWGEEWKTKGYNFCLPVAQDALTYLLKHPRPNGGNSNYNSEQLEMIANELNCMAAILRAKARV